MKRITLSELITILDTIQAGSFFTIITETIPDTYKTVPFHDIKKRQSMWVQFNCSYKNKMEKELAKEGKVYTPKGLQWGESVSKLKFMEHEDNFYIRVMPKSITDIEYTADGKEISEGSIEPYLKKRKIEPIVEYRTINIRNIRVFKFNHEVYEVIA